MTWFETIAGNHRTCAGPNVAEMLGAPRCAGALGSRPASFADARGVHDPLDDLGSASWMITPSPTRPATAARGQ
jgi:hypothetical protein